MAIAVGSHGNLRRRTFELGMRAIFHQFLAEMVGCGVYLEYSGVLEILDIL